MPNAITSIGLTTKTNDELTSQLQDEFGSIYGSDVNLDQDTPDGQMLNIFIQAALDNLDFLTQIYNSFNPDAAFGVTLDQRVAINGIQRQAATHTVTNVTIVTDQAVDLIGQDALVGNPAASVFTVSDSAGTKFQLVTSQSFSAAGTYVQSFVAVNPGAVLTVPNTITNMVTVVLGVSTVNNPTTYASLGVNEETDAQLRIRRQQSVALSSQGYFDGLLAAIENLAGVTSAYVYENVTNVVDADGVPAHSIWVIVQGGTVADIANAIYVKRNAGCGMKGSQSHTIVQLDGSPFTIYWDTVAPEDLFIQFNASSINGVDAIDAVYIANQLAIKFAPGVYKSVNINELATLVQEIDPNCLVTGAGFCLTVGGTYTNTLTPTAKNNQFAVSSANIAITVI
jgi:uncharacterized phage protein gp47/JayE